MEYVLCTSCTMVIISSSLYCFYAEFISCSLTEGERNSMLRFHASMQHMFTHTLLTLAPPSGPPLVLWLWPVCHHCETHTQPPCWKTLLLNTDKLAVMCYIWHANELLFSFCCIYYHQQKVMCFLFITYWCLFYKYCNDLVRTVNCHWD